MPRKSTTDSNAPSKRQLMIAESVKRIVSSVIETDVAFSAVNRVSVTRTVMSGDLRLAKIYVYFPSVLEHQMHAIVRFLRSNSGIVRKQVGKELKMKFVPDVMFVPDDIMMSSEVSAEYSKVPLKDSVVF
jgi:ribosome-binding factor A